MSTAATPCFELVCRDRPSIVYLKKLVIRSKEGGHKYPFFRQHGTLHYFGANLTIPEGTTIRWHLPADSGVCLDADGNLSFQKGKGGTMEPVAWYVSPDDDWLLIIIESGCIVSKTGLMCDEPLHRQHRITLRFGENHVNYSSVIEQLLSNSALCKEESEEEEMVG
jgi:hypothetical protein